MTSHSVSGPDVVDGIAEAWDEVERVGGVLLLAQMSSLKSTRRVVHGQHSGNGYGLTACYRLHR